MGCMNVNAALSGPSSTSPVCSRCVWPMQPGAGAASRQLSLSIKAVRLAGRDPTEGVSQFPFDSSLCTRTIEVREKPSIVERCVAHRFILSLHDTQNLWMSFLRRPSVKEAKGISGHFYEVRLPNPYPIIFHLHNLQYTDVKHDWSPYETVQFPQYIDSAGLHCWFLLKKEFCVGLIQKLPLRDLI